MDNTPTNNNSDFDSIIENYLELKGELSSLG